MADNLEESTLAPNQGCTRPVISHIAPALKDVLKNGCSFVIFEGERPTETGRTERAPLAPSLEDLLRTVRPVLVLDWYRRDRKSAMTVRGSAEPCPTSAKEGGRTQRVLFRMRRAFPFSTDRCLVVVHRDVWRCVFYATLAQLVFSISF